MKLPGNISPEFFDRNYRLHFEYWKEAVEETCIKHNIPTADTRPFTDGSNLIASVGNRYVIKIFPPFLRHQWKSEYSTLRHLNGKVNFSIPELLAYGEREDEWTYVIIHLLPGVTLETVWQKCTLIEKALLLERIGMMMREVHAVPAGELRSLEPEWENFIHCQLSSFKHTHMKLGMPDWFNNHVEDFVNHSVSLLPFDPQPVILTGEYTPFNLLVDGVSGNWSICGMIDFGDTMIGYREYDLLGPILFLAEGDRDLVRSFLRGYGYADTQINKNLQRRLMLLMILHRYSNFKVQLRIPGWQERAQSFTELEQLIWPFV